MTLTSTRGSHVVRCKSDRRPQTTRTTTGEKTARWERTKPYDVTRRRVDGPGGQITALNRKASEIRAKLASGRIKEDVGIALLLRYHNRIEYLKALSTKREPTDLEILASEREAARMERIKRHSS